MTTNDTPQRDIPEREMGLKEWVYRLPDRHRARKEYEQLVATTNDPEARDYPTMDDPEPELSVEDQAALDALPDDLIERIISGKYKPKTAKNQTPEARGVREDAERIWHDFNKQYYEPVELIAYALRRDRENRDTLEADLVRLEKNKEYFVELSCDEDKWECCLTDDEGHGLWFYGDTPTEAVKKALEEMEK